MKKCLMLVFVLVFGVNNLVAGDAKLCVVGGTQSGFWAGKQNNNKASFSYAADGTAGSAYYGWSVGTTCSGSASGDVTALCTGSSSIISGIAACSTTLSGNYSPGASSTGQYCYCKRTHVNGNPSLGVWVFRQDDNNASYCAADCASSCAAYVQGSIQGIGGAFRAVVFAVPVP